MFEVPNFQKRILILEEIIKKISGDFRDVMNGIRSDFPIKLEKLEAIKAI